MSADGLGRRAAVHGTQLALALLGLLAWQLASGTLADPMLVSNPKEVWMQLVEWLEDGTLQTATLNTLSVVGGGLLAGAAAGIAAGWAAGLFRLVGRTVTPSLTVLFAIPKVALVPLFILWFGISYSERLLFTAAVVFFLMYFAAVEGVKAVPQALRNVMLLTGASFWQQMRCLYCPASIGWLLGGCRVAVPYAFVAAVTAEVIASREGLGYLIKSSSAVLNPAGMFACILVLMAVTAAAGVLVGKVEKWSRWHL